MNIKLIAIDLDDTLLNDNLKITPRTIRAIKAAEKKGVQTTICTGRMYVSTYPYAQELGIDIPLITYNGALVKNSLDNNILYERTVPLKETRNVIELCRKYNCHLNVYHQDKLYVENSGYWANRYSSRIKVPLHEVDDLIEFLQEPPTKLLMMADEDILGKIRKNLEGSTLYITKSKSHFLEALNPEATKGIGLEVVAKSLNINRENVMAIGDNENDIEMLKYAGYSVAMANADDYVKEHADYVTGNNNEDGVAKVIEEMVLV